MRGTSISATAVPAATPATATSRFGWCAADSDFVFLAVGQSDEIRRAAEPSGGRWSSFLPALPLQSKGKLMGDITIRIPQKIHIQYTLKSASLAKNIIDLINTVIFRDAAKDDSEHLVNSSSNQPRLGDLALQCFGADAGIDLELPEHIPHQPLELDS